MEAPGKDQTPPLYSERLFRARLVGLWTGRTEIAQCRCWTACREDREKLRGALSL